MTLTADKERFKTLPDDT